MKIFKVIFLASLGISAVLVVTYLWAWKTPGHYLNVSEIPESNLKDYEQAVPGNEPLIIENSNLIVVSLPDVNNPNDLRIKQIEEKWNRFKPDVSLVDMQADFFLPGIMDPVKKFGPAGRIYELVKESKKGNIFLQFARRNIN